MAPKKVNRASDCSLKKLWKVCAASAELYVIRWPSSDLKAQGRESELEESYKAISRLPHFKT